MKKYIIFLLIASLLFSCQLDKEQIVTSLEPLTKAQAMEVAQQEVKDIASSQTAQVWNGNSQVTDAYEVYLDGIDGVSYYECKVTTDGKDSGYVLVNTNGTDFTVVEACETGLTLNESYADSTGLAIGDFDVYRYGYFESVAYASEEDGATLSSTSGKKERKVVGSNGLDVNNFDFDSFKKAVKENNGSPYSTVSYEKEDKLAARGMTGKGDAEVDIKSGEFEDGYDRKSATSMWNQFEMDYKTFKPVTGLGLYSDDRNAVGCGPIAWAIVLSYWQEVHRKENLFAVKDLKGVYCDNIFYKSVAASEYLVAANVVEMNRILKTVSTSRGGGTYTHNMDLIKNYVMGRGYSCNVVHDNGAYDKKFNLIYDQLEKNNPVVMGVHADGIGDFNHYVVVEAAKRQSVKRDSYIRYYCNFGWGRGSHKYVYAFSQKNVPSSINGVVALRLSTYSFWYINID